jgi:4-methyl-5(b-hydroxyethyl)-thiazole monophosphate biosynthesis
MPTALLPACELFIRSSRSSFVRLSFASSRPAFTRFTRLMSSSSSSSFTPTALVPIASGSEEIEFTSIVGTLRRAEIKVQVASISHDRTVLGSRGMLLTSDLLFSDISSSVEFDCILLPGGVEGANNFSSCTPLMELIKKQAKQNKLYGAICASPALCLSPHSLIPSSTAVCHPALFDRLLTSSGKQIYSSQDEIRHAPRVCYDKTNNLLTSVGPASGVEFALHVVALLLGEERALQVAKAMMSEYKAKL